MSDWTEEMYISRPLWRPILSILFCYHTSAPEQSNPPSQTLAAFTQLALPNQWHTIESHLSMFAQPGVMVVGYSLLEDLKEQL